MACTYLLNLGAAPAEIPSSTPGAVDSAARQKTWWQPRVYLGCLSSHTVDAEGRDRCPERHPYPVPGDLLPFQVATRCARTVKVMMDKVKIYLGIRFLRASMTSVALFLHLL